MLPVVGLLEGPSPVSLPDGPLHGLGDGIGVKPHLPLGVPGRPANGLDEASLASQEARLVGVQDGHQGNLGDVQALPQEVDPHQSVKVPEAQVPDQGLALKGIQLVVHVAGPYPVLLQEGGKLLRHAHG